MTHLFSRSFLLCIGILALLASCGGSNEQASLEEVSPPPTTPNNAPRLTLEVDSISLESLTFIEVNFTSSDPDGDSISLSVSESDLINTQISGDTITLSAVAINQQQTEVILVSASDEESTTERSLQVTLLPASSQTQLSLPDSPFNYANVELPTHFLENHFPVNFQFQSAAIISDNTPAENPTTDHGATLGRVLFYDTTLSKSNSVSCASCHLQAEGFSDSRRLSIGFDGGETRRHSMSLANARFYQTGKFFWDERAQSLEQQVLMPIQDEIEMGLTLEELVEAVSTQPYYGELFDNAFADPEITSVRIAQALAQFVRALVSIDTKYDIARGAANTPLDNFPGFSDDENAGKRLFMGFRNGIAPCASCHSSEAFIGPAIADSSMATTSASNNGIDVSSDIDLGVFESTGIQGHRGKFKAPSLRNIEVTAPYMHDGRFNTLVEVIEHYSSGIAPHPTLQPLLKDTDGNPVNYNFTPAEQAQLIAFLITLTDEVLLTDEKFSDPFIR